MTNNLATTVEQSAGPATMRLMQTQYVYNTMPSPVGSLKLVASNNGLAAILWENDNPDRVCLSPVTHDKDHPILAETQRQLEEYFAGKRKVFTVKLDFVGTDFQKKVWQALMTIPFGQTRSYSNIAQQVGNARAVRAVGAANSKNPIAIIGPCHRVIGANGTMIGYAGGLPIKEYLLALEKRSTAIAQPAAH